MGLDIQIQMSFALEMEKMMEYTVVMAVVVEVGTNENY